MAPAVINRLPLVSNLLKWFKGDELTIDNPLFKLHHQATTFIVMFGLLFIFLENHLDGRAIICQGGDQYARSYCWIHGTAYVKEHLQGKATGCYVNQDQMESPADAPVTAYYLWLPFLLTFCFGFAKLPRSLWRNLLEGNMLKNIIGPGTDAAQIAENFVSFRMRFKRYQIYFGFCEFLNMMMCVLSMFVTDALLLNKFFNYGQEVFKYIWEEKKMSDDGKYLTHDPMCELFPTEVSCYIRIGATTGGIDASNYLCILNNNIFNQKYFLVLWMWWMALIGVSVFGLIYRFARLMIPDLSRTILLRKVPATWLRTMELTSGESFVLESMAANMAHPMIEQVIIEISKKDVLKTKWKNVAKNAMKNDFDSVDNHNQSLINQNKNAQNTQI